MATRTRVIARFEGVTTGGVIPFTVPADRVAILKQLAAQNTSGAQATVEWHVRTSGGLTCLLHRATLGHGDHSRADGLFTVLEEGDSLRFAMLGGTNTGRAWASGTLLLGDPA